MTVHELKTWPDPFQAILDRRKKFEARRDDRDYQVGDLLVLREWVPGTSRMWYEDLDKDANSFTGRIAEVLVTYLIRGRDFGLPGDLCVMSVDLVTVS